jgi:hypothetical protein
MSVTGPIHAEQLGTTLPHEHVMVDFVGAERVSRDRYDSDEVFSVVLPHLRDARRLGCQTLVECTPAWIGRDPALLARLAHASGLNILTNTGYYGAASGKFIPRHAREESAQVERRARQVDGSFEFARGGPQGSPFPLKACYGYKYSLGQLHPGLLEKATILYVWVTPEESRRKNFERADPNNPGSILHHGVPIEVMLGDYGCDDMDWLLQHSDRPDTVRVEAHGRTWHLPVGRFDNRVDKTTFVRGDRAQWKEADVAALHNGLAEACGRLVKAVDQAY